MIIEKIKGTKKPALDDRGGRGVSDRERVHQEHLLQREGISIQVNSNGGNRSMPSTSIWRPGSVETGSPVARTRQCRFRRLIESISLMKK